MKTWFGVLDVVYLECDKVWVSVDDVEFLDIEEDFQGRDLMTFHCPRCDREHQSLVRSGGG
jgi:hypothetical protein